MTAIFSRKFRRAELIADIAAVTLAAVLPLMMFVKPPPLAARLAQFILLFGPGAWALARLLPAARFLTNATLRHDIALTPMTPRGFLQTQLRPRLYRAILPGPVLLFSMFVAAIILFQGFYYTLLWLPLLTLWYVNQVILAVLAALIVMRGLLRPRHASHEVLWIAGAAAALAGIVAGVFFGALFLLRVVGLGSLLLPFVALIGLPFWFYNLAFAQWEKLGREYIEFE